MKKTALVVGVLGFGLLCLLWLALGSDRSRRSEARDGGSVARDAVGAESEPQLVGDTVAASAATEGAQSPVARSASARADEVHVRGTIVVVDQDGVEHPAEDGSFELTVDYDWPPHHQKIAVARGRWECDLALHSGPHPLRELDVQDIQLGGRVASLKEMDQVPLPSQGRLDLRVFWPQRSILHVRDRESGRELDPVLEAACNASIFSMLVVHPGAELEPKDLGPSPVELKGGELGDRFESLFIGSPGYAWGKFEFEPSFTGERFLELEPGGSLVVVPRGELPAKAMLRVHRPDVDRGDGFELEAELRDDAGGVRIEGLVPGHLRLRAELGRFPFEPCTLLGEVEVDVVAGRETTVELPVHVPPPIARVPLEGSLVVPSAWNANEFTLDIDRHGADRISIARSAMTSVAGSADTFYWSAGLVEPGSYEASVDAVTFCDPLEVGPDGLHDARVEVPPPCEVEVRCVREETGAELGPEGVAVSGNRALTERTWHVATQPPSWDAIARCWHLRIPVGRIELTAKAEWLARERREVEVVAGTNEVVLRLQRKTGLTLIFRDGAVELPERWFQPKLDPLEKEESSVRDAFDAEYEHGRYTFLRKPGRYTLKMKRADGYEAVPDAIVELEKGVVKEHVIELRRKL